MRTNQVAFTGIYAVWGKKYKVDSFNRSIPKDIRKGMYISDITNYFKRNPSDGGLMTNAAQRGDTVEICVTGERDKKMYLDAPMDDYGLADFISNIDTFADLGKIKIKDAIKKIPM